MISAIAVDMDGTFLNSNKQFDETRFERIFKTLRDNHIQFIAASGNQYAKLKSIFGVRDMFFISENGAVIYKGNQLYNYRSFNRKEFQNVVDYLNIDHNMKELIVCGLSLIHISEPTRPY